MTCRDDVGTTGPDKSESKRYLLVPNCFLGCYMPSSMIDSIIVPLVQNKCGNLADNNNYRPIALFSIPLKVLVLL